MSLASLAAWCAALFLAATVFSHTVALRLILLAAGLVFAVAAAWRTSTGMRAFAAALLPPLAFPFALWAAWAALSLNWSLDPEITGKELRNEIGYTFLALCLCHASARAPGSARVFVAVLGAASFAVCAVALQYLGGPPADARWLHGGPGTYSSTLLVLFPCTLAFLWFAAVKGRSKRLLGAGALLVLLFGVSGYVTQNRTLWIGLALQVLMFALFAILRHGEGALRGRRGAVTLALAASLVVAGAAALGTRVHHERLAAAPSAQLNDPRIAIWRAALGKIEKRPLVGTGFGRGIARGELRSETGDANALHTHNLVLDTLLQLGAIGLVLLALLLGNTLWLAWRMLRSADSRAAACGIALAAVVAGMLMRNMTDVLWVRQAALLYWGVTGALLGWGLASAAGAGAAR